MNHQNQRTFARRPVIWSGVLATGDEKYPCQIWNVSLSGAKVKAKNLLETGTPICLEIRRCGYFRGQIVWQEEGTMGVKFDAMSRPDKKALTAIIQGLGQTS